MICPPQKWCITFPLNILNFVDSGSRSTTRDCFGAKRERPQEQIPLPFTLSYAILKLNFAYDDEAEAANMLRLFEIKSSQTIHQESFIQLNKVAAIFGERVAKKVVLYAGHEQQIRSNAEVVSYLYAGAAGSSDSAINSFD